MLADWFLNVLQRSFFTGVLKQHIILADTLRQQKQLLDFMDSFQIDHNIALDPVYTAKMLFGVVDQIRQNKIERGSTILGAAYRRYSRVGIRKAVNAKAIFKQPSPYVR